MHHKKRLIEKIKEEHDYLKQEKIIKEWEIAKRSKKHTDSVEDTWEITIADENPLKKKMEKLGQKIRKRKRFRKKLIRKA